VTVSSDRPRSLGETPDRARRGFLLVLVTVVLTTACASGYKPKSVGLPPPSEKTAVGAGDIFTLQIVGEKDLPTEFQVASDGTAQVPFLQKIQVAGLEPQDIAKMVREQLIARKFLVDPVVIVQVREYHSRTVILLGQVAKPGSFPLTPGLTLMQAISMAGGLTAIADDDKVTLTRKIGQGTKTVRVSVDAITDGTAQDVVLQAGDRVFVYERLF
jgi:protein involved in polysaccharide export with SLBB domain